MADGMGILSGAASGAATGSAGGPAGMAIGAGLGAISAAKSNNMSEGEYHDLNRQMGLQSMWNNTQAEKSYELQKRMFDYSANYNSAANQVKRLQEAGLNPALMYGMQGAAGGTGQTGSASASGVGANSSDTAERRTASVMERGMALQEAKLAADIRLTNSQADNLEVDAKKKAGVDTEVQHATLKQLIQQTTNERVKQSLLLIERDIQSFSAADQIDNIATNAKKAREELTTMERNNEIGEGTKESIMNEIREKAIGAYLDNALKRSGLNLQEEQIKAIKEGVKQNWETIRTNWKNADTNEKNAITSRVNSKSGVTYQGVDKVLGRVINDLVYDAGELVDNEYTK